MVKAAGQVLQMFTWGCNLNVNKDFAVSVSVAPCAGSGNFGQRLIEHRLYDHRCFSPSRHILGYKNATSKLRASIFYSNMAAFFRSNMNEAISRVGNFLQFNFFPVFTYTDTGK
jgi:hypothetical protein